MLDLLMALAVGLVAMPWMIARAADWRDGMEHMDSRAWINHLADRSRKKDARPPRTRGKYSMAGIYRP